VKVNVDRYRRLTLPQQGRIARVIAEHEAILSAIAVHDASGAKNRNGNSSRKSSRQYLRHSEYQSGVFRHAKLAKGYGRKKSRAADIRSDEDKMTTLLGGAF